MMSIIMTMPQLGESVVEGVIVRWLKREGEHIARDEPLLEIMTDKVNAELPSTEEGTLLRIIAQEGETVLVGAPIAELEFAASGSPAARPEAKHGLLQAIPREERAVTSDPRGASQPAIHASGDTRTREVYSPLVRNLARQYDLDLRAIAGTGLGGRVTRDDVLAFVAAGKPDAPIVPSPVVPDEETPRLQDGIGDAITPTPGVADEVVALTPMRRAIAEHMARSAREAPHAVTVHEVDVTDLVRWRTAHKAEFSTRHGAEITILAFIVSAAAGALRDIPILNSSWSEQGIVLKKRINIGVAVALDQGLIVPVIARADELRLPDIARAVADLALRAREGRLLPAEVRDGTFTISNVGAYGSILAVPVIHQPQAAILAVGKVQKRVVVLEDDMMAIRSMLYLSLAFDHRVVDGIVACQFMEALCARLRAIDLDAL